MPISTSTMSRVSSLRGELNDMKGLCEEDEIAHVLCEGGGEIKVDIEGKKYYG